MPLYLSIYMWLSFIYSFFLLSLFRSDGAWMHAHGIGWSERKEGNSRGRKGGTVTKRMRSTSLRVRDVRVWGIVLEGRCAERLDGYFPPLPPSMSSSSSSFIFVPSPFIYHIRVVVINDLFTCITMLASLSLSFSQSPQPPPPSSHPFPSGWLAGWLATLKKAMSSRSILSYSILFYSTAHINLHREKEWIHEWMNEYMAK